MGIELNGKTVTEVMAPVAVTVVGTDLVSGTKATTPPDQPNIVINVVRPIVALSVRAAHVYIGNLVGILGAAMVKGDLIPASSFGNMLLECAGLAVAGTVVLMLKDIVTLLSGLEQKFPLLTGSV